MICLDPPPTWIKLTALETVYGAAPERIFFASTTSHRSHQPYGKIEQPI